MLGFLILTFLLAWRAYPHPPRDVPKETHYDLHFYLDKKQQAAFQRQHRKAMDLKKAGYARLAEYEFNMALQMLKENQADETLAASVVYYHIAELAIDRAEQSQNPKDYIDAAYYYEKGLVIQHDKQADAKFTSHGHNMASHVYQRLNIMHMAEFHFAYFYDETVREYGKYDPRTYDLLHVWGSLYCTIKKHSEGIPIYLALLNFPPKNRKEPLFSDYQAYLCLGEAYTVENKFDKAVHYYKKVVHYPSFAKQELVVQAHILHRLGVVLGKSGNFNSSLDQLKKALHYMPSKPNHDRVVLHSKILYDIGVVYGHMGYYNESCNYFDDAYTLCAKQVEENSLILLPYLRARAICYENKRAWNDALVIYLSMGKMLRENKDFDIIMVSQNTHDVGRVYHKSRDYAQALSHHLKALAHRQDSGVLSDHLLAYSYWQVCQTMRQGWGFYAAFFYCKQACRLDETLLVKSLCQEVQERLFWGYMLAPIMRHIEDIFFVDQSGMLDKEL